MKRSNLTKKKKREIVYKWAKKSIIYKPLVFKRMYRVSTKARKNAVNKYLEKYVDIKTLSSEERKFLRRDLIYCKVVYNISYPEYFMYGFRNKSHFKRKNFIPNKDRTIYLHLLGTKKGYQVLTDKYRAYKKLKKYYKREIIKLEKEEDYQKFKDYIKKYPTFVKKPLGSSFGKGIELIDSTKYKNKKTLFNNIIKEGPHILEEQIIQNDVMASLHPSSLNTVRIVTYVDEKNNVTIHLPFIKIGQGGSFIDNGRAGGILALIDDKTGIIITDGKDELNRVFKYHPNTKVKIKGFKIPMWNEAIELAKKAALDYFDTKYIGWDIAISKDKGPIIVEGNGRTQFFGQQITDEIGKRKDLEKLINYKKLKIKNKNLYESDSL